MMTTWCPVSITVVELLPTVCAVTEMPMPPLPLPAITLRAAPGVLHHLGLVWSVTRSSHPTVTFGTEILMPLVVRPVSPAAVPAAFVPTKLPWITVPAPSEMMVAVPATV
jgi:hypothetical protein